MKKDAPSEETLAEDLFEQSSKVFHREMARFQETQLTRLLQIEAETTLWLAAENAKPYCLTQDQNLFYAETHVAKMRDLLRHEMYAYRDVLLEQLRARNHNLASFLLTHGSPEPHAR